ncbi:MAG: hypothetical protein SFY95_07935 [Planctomycetota bacterium]|nr:hypothetical protein [Planctomycetota bacterium]
MKAALCLISLALAIGTGWLWSFSVGRCDSLVYTSIGPTRTSTTTAPDGSALYNWDEVFLSVLSFDGRLILRRQSLLMRDRPAFFATGLQLSNNTLRHDTDEIGPDQNPRMPWSRIEPPLYVFLGMGVYTDLRGRDRRLYIPWWLITGALLVAPTRGLWILLKHPRGCPDCGYSRQGLAPDAPCPECGTASVRTL